MIPAQVGLRSAALTELTARVVNSGLLTSSDRSVLKAELLQPSLSEFEKGLIDRLVEGVRQGSIYLVDAET